MTVKRMDLVYGRTKKNLAISKVKWLPQRDGHYSRNLLCTIYSGTLPYDHLINIITLLLHSLFCAEKRQSHYVQKIPSNSCEIQKFGKHAIK